MRYICTIENYEEQYREEQLNADDELGIEKKVEIVKEEQSIE